MFTIRLLKFYMTPLNLAMLDYFIIYLPVIYSYTESQECIDPTFNFLTINVCGGFRPFIECINIFKYTYILLLTYII